MNYTKLPELRSVPTPKQLFEQTEADPIRSKLLGKIRAGEFKSLDGICLVDEDILKDAINTANKESVEKNNNPILEALIAEGRRYCRFSGCLRDVIVKSKFSSDKKSFEIIVTDKDGLKLNDDRSGLLLNLNLYPETKEREIHIKWVATDDTGKIAFVAAYENVFSKLAKKAKDLIWKS